jgi:hypothetical protein
LEKILARGFHAAKLLSPSQMASRGALRKPTKQWRVVESHPKVLLFCAHRWEANPFLEQLEMHPPLVPTLPFPEFYQPNGDYALYLTGTGSERAAAVVASVLSRLPQTEGRVVANFGTAGSDPGAFEIGEAVLVNRSLATASGRSFYPDRLVRSSLPEATCYTLSRPGQEVTTPPAKSVYDMELSGVLVASELYVHSSQTVCGKVVSDYLSDDPPDWREMVKAIADLYRAACLSFLEVLDSQRTLLARSQRSLQAESASRWVKSAMIEPQNYFTVTQCRQLEAALRARALSCANEETWFETLEEMEFLITGGPKASKKERSDLFAQILQSVWAPTLFSEGN